MGGVRDEADVAVLLASVSVVGHDGAQTCKLSLGSAAMATRGVKVGGNRNTNTRRDIIISDLLIF